MDNMLTRLLLRPFQQSKPMNFFDFPPEIRDHIYCLAMEIDTDNPTIERIPHDKCGRKGQQLWKVCTSECVIQPSVTKVSRRVRKESLKVFYSMSRFVMCDSSRENPWRSPYLSWFKAMGDDNASQIRWLRVISPNGKFVLQRGEGLQLVEFKMREFWVKGMTDSRPVSDAQRAEARRSIESLLRLVTKEGAIKAEDDSQYDAVISLKLVRVILDYLAYFVLQLSRNKERDHPAMDFFVSSKLTIPAAPSCRPLRPTFTEQLKMFFI